MSNENIAAPAAPTATRVPVAAEAAPATATAQPDVLRVHDIAFEDAAALLARYGLRLQRVADGADIPGSYWGDCEAGLIGCTVYVRGDTPVHSLLHEACHLVVLPPGRRESVHTDATDSVEEEDAVCVLQALLADELPGVGRERLLADMDAWGYSFRLGSAGAYVERDADDAWRWLIARGLATADRRLVSAHPSLQVGATPPTHACRDDCTSGT